MNIVMTYKYKNTIFFKDIEFQCFEIRTMKNEATVEVSVFSKYLRRDKSVE